MGRKHHKPEEIVGKLRQVEVLTAQGKPVIEAVRAIGVTEATYYRWRAEYGGLKLDQVKRLKLLEQENSRLRRAVADLTLEKLVLKPPRETTERCPSSSLPGACDGDAGRFGTLCLPGAGNGTARRSAGCPRRPTTRQR